MEYLRLGKSNLLASRVASSAVAFKNMRNAEAASLIIQRAYESGVNLFDTSRSKAVSEKLLGDTLHEVRENVIIATKSRATSVKELLRDVDESLAAMHADAIDIYQYEIDKFIPKRDGADGIYATLVRMKENGKIKHIGAATEDFDIALEIVKSDMYETLQFPFSMISPVVTKKLIDLCIEHDIGFIASRPLCGGLLSNIPLALGFLRQFENVIPLWNAATIEELAHILYFNNHPPVIDESFERDIEKVRKFFS